MPNSLITHAFLGSYPRKLRIGLVKEIWIYYTLEKRKKDSRDLFLRISKSEIIEFKYQYFDRVQKVCLALNDRLLVPPGLLDIERFGIPFPDLECILNYENQSKTKGRRGSWLYLRKEPKKGDVGQVMTKPNPNDLPPAGAPWIVAKGFVG
jgi:hypothetical protein